MEKAINRNGLNLVHYWRCSECGFVMSKTHYDMTQEEWENLNRSYHESYLGSGENEDDPRWMSRLVDQSENIVLLAKLGVLPKSQAWLDFGCGDGTLADMLGNLGLPTQKFDRYMHQEGYLSEKELVVKKYGVVFNCSMFEHVLSIDPIDEIMGLVAEDGVLALHTMVREEIPPDPEWFYLLPVHCAFYTNKSMQLLFEKYDFKASLYHVESRMWFWFRDIERANKVQNISKFNGEIMFKFGFADYWK